MKSGGVFKGVPVSGVGYWGTYGLTSLVLHGILLLGMGSLCWSNARFGVMERDEGSAWICSNEGAAFQVTLMDANGLASEVPSKENSRPEEAFAEAPPSSERRSDSKRSAKRVESTGSGQVCQLRAAANPPPGYPEEARQKGWQGVVFLWVRVNGDGRPEMIRIERSAGYSVLDQAAVKAVEHWTFVPARMGSMAMASTLKIPIRFVLGSEK